MKKIFCLNRVIVFLLLFAAGCQTSNIQVAKRNYTFDGSISREVLENYLDRAITMDALSFSDTPEDDFRMIENIGAKFVGRVSYIWNAKTDFPNYYGALVDDEDLFHRAEYTCKRLHEIDPEIIVQADIFEIIEKCYVNAVKIPARVFEEFGLEPQERNFNYDAMLYDNGVFHDNWGPEQSVPDMSKLETRMWFFYRASRYIDMGYEAIHFGQCHLMDKTDSGHKNWWDTITRVRNYAKKHARRHFVLCDSHTHGITDDNGNLMYDFHMWILRPEEIPAEPEKAELLIGKRDSIFTRSKGGVTPSGWECDSLPYLVEFDNTHASGREGQGGMGGCWVWGYEEISWFAHRGYTYRSKWLEYVTEWLKENDPVGYLRMPGNIPMAFYYGNGKRLRYRMNNNSEKYLLGYGQEETVKRLWSK